MARAAFVLRVRRKLDLDADGEGERGMPATKISSTAATTTPSIGRFSKALESPRQA